MIQFETKILIELLDKLESGSRPKGGVRNITEGVISIGAEHLDNHGSFNFTNKRYIPAEFALTMRRGKIMLNDILIVKDGATTGRVSFIDHEYPYENSFTNEHVFICRASKHNCSKYIFYYLRSTEGQRQIMTTFHGGAQGGINSEFAKEVYIPLATKEEQQQIVEKLDAILPKIRKVKERLEKIPDLLKKFRQSVLSAACTGKLTEDWRSENSIEYKWERSTLKDVAYKISTGPFGTMLHNSDYIANGIPVINPINIKANRITPDFNFCISTEMVSKLSKYKLQKNDIILARRGDLSKCGIVSETEENWIAGTGTFFIRTHMNPFYFRMNYQNRNTQGILNHNSIGSTMPNLNQGILGKIEIFVPSLKEQNEIVRRVDELFAHADSLETKYKKTMERIEKIEQSVLAKAFRGEFV